MSHFPILIKDSKNVMNILVQLNLKKNVVGVLSGYSPSKNLLLLIEGLGMTIEKCVDEGMDRKEVFDVVNKHLIRCIGNYKRVQ